MACYLHDFVAGYIDCFGMAHNGLNDINMN